MLANLVEFPAVPKGQARFRLQVMANHTQHDIVDAVHRLSASSDIAESELTALTEGRTTIEKLSQVLPKFNVPADYEEKKAEAVAEKPGKSRRAAA